MQTVSSRLFRFWHRWRPVWQWCCQAAASPESGVMRVCRVLLKVLFAAYLVFCFLFLGLRYAVLPQIARYKPNVESMISEGIGRQVTIARIDASWYGFYPQLELNGLVIHDAEGLPALRLPEVKALVSWRSFAVFDLCLAMLEIDRPELDIRRDRNGKLFVAGLPVDTHTRKEGGGIDWVLRQGKIAIRDGIIRWQDERRNAPGLALENLNFMLENSARQHRLRMVAHSSLVRSGEIDIRARFSHPFFAGSLSDISGWKGELYVALPEAELEPLKPYVDFPQCLQDGAGAVNVWMAFDRGRIADVAADVDLKRVTFRFSRNLPLLALKQVAGRITARALPDEDAPEDTPLFTGRAHTIALERFSLETADGIRLKDLDFAETYFPAAEGRQARTELKTANLDLATLVALAGYLPLPPEQRKMLDEFSPSGRLEEFSLRWEGQFPDLVSYQLSGGFSQAGIRAVPARPASGEAGDLPREEARPAIPGFANLSGQVFLNEKGGSLELDAAGAVLHLPAYFPQADWVFDEMKMRANWSRQAEGQFVFALEKMDFLLDGMAVSLSGRHTCWPDAEKPAGPGMIDLTAAVRQIDMTKTGRYVPLGTKEALRVWLTKAFEAGTASNVVVRLKGDLAQFPFSGSQKTSDSEFRVSMDVHDARLNYAPTLFGKDGKPVWQPIEKINGRFAIDGGKILIHADTAMLEGAVLSDVDVTVPDMLAEEVLLDIAGTAGGELQDFVRFANASPINEVIGGLTEEAETKGRAALLLKMQMPLSRMAETQVKGTLQFDGNEIHLFPDLPVLTLAQGKVHFSDKGFELEGVRAQFLGGEVSFSGGTQEGASKVLASGVLTAEGLRRNYAGETLGRLMERMSGRLPYTLSIIRKKDAPGGGYPDISLESGLNGFGIDLPAPLGKKRGESRPLKVTAHMLPPVGKNRRDEIRIAYGDSVFARYERQKTGKGWQLARGGLGVNVEPVLQPGLSFHFRAPLLDVNAWQDVLEPLAADTGRAKGSAKTGGGALQYLMPGQFFIEADELNAMEFRLTHAAVTGAHQEGRWLANVGSREMKGQLVWTEPEGSRAAGKLAGRFAFLTIPRSEPQKIEDIIRQDNVSHIPAIDLIVDDLRLFDIRLGRVELVASSQAGKGEREWRISRLAVSNPDGRLQSEGRWTAAQSGASKTRLAYDLEIHDAGRLLSRFGYKDIIRGGKGKMHGDISWDGLPYSLDIPSLSGKIDLHVNKGQFLKVEPGIGRLLGVLSMQSLPQRLTLDFRDIFSEGFAFDEVTVLAEIAKGIAKTENLTMRGVQATVLMDGSVDIAGETQNLHVAVLPEINAGMASLAYSVINPAIGVGTFLAQLFLKDPLSKTFTYEYQITGSWAEPNISKIKNRDNPKGKGTDAATPTSKEETWQR
ncbi:MAG: TIGR02099 family protein [Oxalobacter formigenes]|nr:TIGR02099 family protein [Oxalobacter formigenes]